MASSSLRCNALHWLAVVPLLTLLLASCPLSEASEGDEAELFQSCMRSCLQTGCTKTPGSSNTCDTVCSNGKGYSNHRVPWTLRFMGWDCEADCSYHCMWALEVPKHAAGDAAVHKYYGKWPFVRVLGAQEVVSVVFSVANLLAHVHNLKTYLESLKSHKQCVAGSQRSANGCAGAKLYPYANLWVVYAAVNINAWLWSSVFHCRDTRVTERLDYFSADLVVAVGLGVVLVRMLQLASVRSLLLVTLVLGMLLLQHIHYMAFVKFDYGYNMKLCIFVGVSTAVAWIVWATKTRHSGRWTLLKFMALVHVAMLLEVLDFPPMWHLFDAHALWHAATVPLTYLWYRFIAADMLMWQQQQQLLLQTAGDGRDTAVTLKGVVATPVVKRRL